MANILIVDDDRELCDLLTKLLRGAGHATQTAPSGEEAVRVARTGQRVDVVLLDLKLGGMDGLETLRCLRSVSCPASVVMLTGVARVQDAVLAMKLGAADFVTKPFDQRVLLEHVERMVGARPDARRDAPVLVGSSPRYVKAFELARRFAGKDISILLLGETGTGKELFARAIHAASPRARAAFVPVDCSTLAESLIESELFGHEKGSFTGATGSRIGRFELAQGGTLFLDEIGNLPMSIQAKLLRVLQTRQLERVGGREPIKLDVRVVAATNVDLEAAIAAGRFRQDLYFRLQEMTIELPALRERAGDVAALARHFIGLYSSRFDLPPRGLSDAALQLLERYEWPGNTRELENAMKSAVVLANDVIGPEDLPAPIRARAEMGFQALPAAEADHDRLRFEVELGLGDSDLDLKALGAQAAEQAERSVLLALIQRGSRSSAHLARCLSVDPKTLRLKLRRYGLSSRCDGARLPVPALAADRNTASPSR
jgi:DNA-binding NtrC family response regulator